MTAEACMMVHLSRSQPNQEGLKVLALVTLSLQKNYLQIVAKIVMKGIQHQRRRIYQRRGAVP